MSDILNSNSARPEAGTKYIARRPLRMILWQKPFLKQENLAFPPGRRVEDRHEEATQVDLDAACKLWEGIIQEVLIVQKSELLGVKVDFDDVGLSRVAEETCSARHIHSEYAWQFVE